MANTGAILITLFSPSNAHSCSEPQLHSSFSINFISGLAILLYPLINHQEKLVNPKKDCTSFLFLGFSQSATPLTLIGSMHTCPSDPDRSKYSTSNALKIHFLAF